MIPKEQLLAATPSIKQGLDLTHLKLTPKEAFILSRIDGRSKLKDVASASAMSPEDALGAILPMVFKEIIIFKEYTVDQIKSGAPVAAPRPAQPAQPRPPPQQPPRPQNPPAAQPPRPQAPPVAQQPRPAAPAPAANKLDFDIDAGGWDAMAGARPAAAAAPPPPQQQAAPQPAPQPQPVAAPPPPPQYTQPPIQPRPMGPPPQRPPGASPPARLIQPLVQRKDLGEDFSTKKFEGNLVETSYPKLLTKIYKVKETGILRIARQQGGPYKDIYFRSGNPLYIGGTYISEKECLGQLLKMSGKITEFDLNKSLETVKQPGDMLQGQALLRMGIINSSMLASALKWQLEIKLAEIFTWRLGEGFFEFYTVGGFKRTLEMINVPLAPIILKGIKRGFPYQIVQSEMLAKMAYYVVKIMPPPFEVEDFKFQLPETRIWEKVIDGSTSVKEIIEKSQMDPQLVSQYLYAMNITGMITLSEKPAGGTEEDKLIEDLKSRLALSQKGDHFEALGIHWSCVAHKVQEGWEKIQKEYGPDSKIVKNSLNEETKLLAAQIYKLGKMAYDYLIDTPRRMDYRNSLHNETKITLSAELLYQQAESQLLIKEDYRNALEALESAAELVPRNFVIQAAYGCALVRRHFPNKPEGYREGEKVLQRCINAASNNEMVHYFAGHAYWTMGRTNQAKQEFEATIKLNPSNLDAKKALRALSKGT